MSTPQEKPEYVLFFSMECKYSKNFLNKIKQKEELFKKFNLVDIDKLQIIPDEIDEVPCVYDGKTLFKGNDGFKWLNEQLSNYFSAANDGLQYSFVDGNNEQVFNNYSLLDQQNGSHGMGDPPSDPARMAVSNDNTNKNRTLDSLVAARSTDITNFSK